MKRKFMAIVIAVLLLLSLTSCGKPDVVITGEVTHSSQIDYGYFLMDTEDGHYTGVVITDKTKIDYGGYDAPISDYYIVSVECDEVVTEEVFAYYSWRNFIDKWYIADKITVTGKCTPIVDPSTSGFGKPVIYLYPEEETDVTVDVDFGGELVCTYPKSDGTWSVTAKPDGTLSDANGTEYNYIFWEGEAEFEFDFSKGFCVKGEDTAKFLETALAELGLTRREANEFIVYWLPLMEGNEYNVISFQGENYDEFAKLNIEPAPDTVIRVYMAWYGAEEEISIEPQNLTAPERDGFTVIEWGGTEIK